MIGLDTNVLVRFLVQDDAARLATFSDVARLIAYTSLSPPLSPRERGGERAARHYLLSFSVPNEPSPRPLPQGEKGFKDSAPSPGGRGFRESAHFEAHGF